jgi:hypothetical protein
MRAFWARPGAEARRYAARWPALACANPESTRRVHRGCGPARAPGAAPRADGGRRPAHPAPGAARDPRRAAAARLAGRRSAGRWRAPPAGAGYGAVRSRTVRMRSTFSWIRQKRSNASAAPRAPRRDRRRGIRPRPRQCAGTVACAAPPAAAWLGVPCHPTVALQQPSATVGRPTACERANEPPILGPRYQATHGSLGPWRCGGSALCGSPASDRLQFLGVTPSPASPSANR